MSVKLRVVRSCPTRFPGAGVNPATREIRSVELVAPVLTVLEAVGRRHPDSPMHALFTDPRWHIEYGDGRRVVALNLADTAAELPAPGAGEVLAGAASVHGDVVRLEPHGWAVLAG